MQTQGDEQRPAQGRAQLRTSLGDLLNPAAHSKWRRAAFGARTRGGKRVLSPHVVSALSHPGFFSIAHRRPPIFSSLITSVDQDTCTIMLNTPIRFIK